MRLRIDVLGAKAPAPLTKQPCSPGSGFGFESIKHRAEPGDKCFLRLRPHRHRSTASPILKPPPPPHSGRVAITPRWPGLGSQRATGPLPRFARSEPSPHTQPYGFGMGAPRPMPLPGTVGSAT